jgi:ATP-dependent helicase HrpB
VGEAGGNAAAEPRKQGLVQTVQSSLPIWELRDRILAALREQSRMVLIAPTGSGKTTQVPQMLLDAGMVDEADAGSGARASKARRIVVLQPRRVAARTVAARVAWERNCQLGGEVGYQIRFDDQTSLGTRICFVTEGVLLRWLQTDPLLSEVGVILFDEFHERNLLSDVALALAKQLQRTKRPELKLAVMSATLEARPVAAYLAGCPVLVSEGQTYPVEVQYSLCPDERPCAEQVADAVEQIVGSGAPGDILVFLPGMAEINAAILAIRAARLPEPVALIPLHGDLPPEDQDRAFAPHAVRKVVVATNVAETSVTIDGIRHVIDSGLARIARYDPERGIHSLLVEPISRASADQRKGRAGRTAPGTCHRLWTESGQLNRPESNTPEIQRSDLAEVVLLLHSLGIRQAAEFDWLDRPDVQGVERAEKLLRTLGAINGGGAAFSDLTPTGWRMLELPVHPRYSRMLVEAARRGCVEQAALCAALVSGRNLLVRLGRDDRHIAAARELFEVDATSDFFTLMRAFQYARNQRFNVEACRRYGVHAQIAREVARTYEQILEIARPQGMSSRPSAADSSATSASLTRESRSDEPLLRCLVTGFIDQLCLRRSQGTLECHLTEGRAATLMRESIVQSAPLFVAAEIREVSARGGEALTLVGLATAAKREWIEEMFPQSVSSRVEHRYDHTHRRVEAVRLTRFQDLVIHWEHQRQADPAASGRCLAEAHRKGWFELPLFTHELKQFTARVNLVSRSTPELELPLLDEEGVLRVLANALHGVITAKEAQTIPLREAFFKHLPPEQLSWIDELAPLSLAWPDGRKLKLLYATPTSEPHSGLASPELQVKLHECFALKGHPRVCEGRVAVKLWLCAPDGKRLEATSDWPAFRQNQYLKLRPTLQEKYPGMTWL